MTRSRAAVHLLSLSHQQPNWTRDFPKIRSCLPFSLSSGPQFYLSRTVIIIGDMEQNGATTQQGVLRTSEMAVDEEEEGGGPGLCWKAFETTFLDFPSPSFSCSFYFSSHLNIFKILDESREETEPRSLFNVSRFSGLKFHLRGGKKTTYSCSKSAPQRGVLM